MKVRVSERIPGMRYEIKIKKGEKTISLPGDRVLELLSECSESELKALFFNLICSVHFVSLRGQSVLILIQNCCFVKDQLLLFPMFL